MKKLIAIRFLFCLVIFIASFAIATPRSFASHKVFKENFDSNSEGSFPNGWTIVNDPDRIPCLAQWKTIGGMAGIAIVNQAFCTTNIMPNDNLWNNLGDNYIFEFDMKFVKGSGHNVAFRFTPSTPTNNWYDLSFILSGDFLLERVTGNYTINIPSKYPIGKTYHMKIILDHKNIKIYIDNVLVRDFTSTVDNFPTGRIALRAGTGTDVNSETYFDNIVVTNIDAPLDVPLLKQTDSLWKDDEYDTATEWAEAGEATTINRWGCAMTSAAMILNYHGIKKLPDGSDLQPDTLNLWLKNYEGDNGGYIRGDVNWAAIASLSKLAKTVNNITDFDALEFVWGDNDTTKLKNQLDSNNPVILQVPDHFIVAKGVNGDTFDINDPFYDDRHTLKDEYNNTYLSSRRFIPSFTNLSYLIVVVDPDVDMYLTNSSGQKAGSNGITTYTDIPNAVYYLEHGIKDPISKTTSPDYKMLLIPKPNNDTYSITIATTSAAINQFKLETYRHTATGSATVNKISSQTRTDEPAMYSFSYQQNPSTTPSAPTDTTPPQIKSTKTLDTNNNDKIDTIEVTFVRDINGTTVNPTGTDFTVDGYDIKKAKETSPGVVQITVSEKSTNDTGVTPLVTLKNNNIKDTTSDTYNHQQTATPTDGIAPTKPTTNPPGDKYLSPQKVELTSLDKPNKPTIFYTLDGSDPATSSAKLIYTAPVIIDGSSITLKAIAQDAAGNKSEVMTESYEIAPKIDDTSITVATSSATSFTVTWTTDRPSYSRLVFGTKSKKVKGSDTKYGYDKTTNEASIKQTTHTITLSGLTAGTTYYYRLISRGSPEQVTDERSITLANDSTPTPTPTPTPLVSPEPAAKAETTISSNSTSSTVCSDEKPQSGPTITSSFAGINTVALSWKEGSGPISYYLIAYGTEPGKLQYGNPNIGGKGTTSFVVENLSGWQTYYFKVRAGNGCTPGDYSNEISATPIGFSEEGQATGFKENVLGVSTVKEVINNQKVLSQEEQKNALPKPSPIVYQKNGVDTKEAIIIIISGISILSTGFYLLKTKLSK